MSSLLEQLESLKWKRVRVESTEGHRYEGTLEWVSGDGPGVVLRDAQELPGDAQFVTVFVPRVNWIVATQTD